MVKLMPRRLDHNEINYIARDNNVPSNSFNVITYEEAQERASRKTNSRNIINKVGAFQLYTENVTYDIKQYFVEHIPTEKRVTLDEALKEGEINGLEIDSRFYDWLHDFDEGLD